MRAWVASSVLAASLCAAAPTANNDALKVPVSRRQPVIRSTGQVDPALYFGELQWTIQKYDPSFELPFTVTDVIGKCVSFYSIRSASIDSIQTSNRERALESLCLRRR
jgi:hypothetical protein